VSVGAQSRRASAGAVALALAVSVSTVAAQWPNRPLPGVPRAPDGSPNLAAPAPRAPDGRPDLSGVWEPMPDPGGKPGGIEGIVAPRYLQDVTRDVPDRSTLMLPSADALYKARAANQFLDNPQTRCLPAGVPRVYALTQPYKIVQGRELVVILHEIGTLFRQIFLDGRGHPADPQPTWMGYSIGRWDGESLVVETIGFNDQTWLDGTGHPHSERMRLTERFTRRSVGRMDLEITIDDPGTYTRPIRYVQPQVLLPEGELIEFVCGENVKPLRR
jgi:hypothetical protein